MVNDSLHKSLSHRNQTFRKYRFTSGPIVGEAGRVSPFPSGVGLGFLDSDASLTDGATEK